MQEIPIAFLTRIRNAELPSISLSMSKRRVLIERTGRIRRKEGHIDIVPRMVDEKQKPQNSARFLMKYTADRRSAFLYQAHSAQERVDAGSHDVKPVVGRGMGISIVPRQRFD